MQLPSHWPALCYLLILNCKGNWEILLAQCFSYVNVSDFSPPETSLVCSVTSYIEYALGLMPCQNLGTRLFPPAQEFLSPLQSVASASLTLALLS